jgi:hypothetical protein
MGDAVWDLPLRSGAYWGLKLNLLPGLGNVISNEDIGLPICRN